jgi:hypothetical protein
MVFVYQDARKISRLLYSCKTPIMITVNFIFNQKAVYVWNLYATIAKL